MKLQQLDIRGTGRTVKVSLLIADRPESEEASQWLEARVELPVQGVMDEETLHMQAMTILRDALNAEIATLRSGPFG